MATVGVKRLIARMYRSAVTNTSRPHGQAALPENYRQISQK